MYQYHLTDLDVLAYEREPFAWSQRRLQDRIRWYTNDWTETRFVRHASAGAWTDTGWPEGPLRTALATVPIRHYQYRSPEQIDRRLAVRRATSIFPHEKREGDSSWHGGNQMKVASWRDRVV